MPGVWSLLFSAVASPMVEGVISEVASVAISEVAAPENNLRERAKHALEATFTAFEVNR